MNQMTVYPYEKNPAGYFPAIPFTLYKGNKEVMADGLIDSGATISIFKEELADFLGINIKDGRPIYLGGVGGRILGYIHQVKIEIAGKKFSCPAVFSEEYKVSFNLLGRKGIFDKFLITFDEKNKLLKLEEGEKN